MSIFACLLDINFTFPNSFHDFADRAVLAVFTSKHTHLLHLAYVAFLVSALELHAFLVKFSLQLCGVSKDLQKTRLTVISKENALFCPLCSKISLHSSVFFVTLFNQSIIQNITLLQSSFSNMLSVVQHQQDEKDA